MLTSFFIKIYIFFRDTTNRKVMLLPNGGNRKNLNIFNLHLYVMDKPCKLISLQILKNDLNIFYYNKKYTYVMFHILFLRFDNIK